MAEDNKTLDPVLQTPNYFKVFSLDIVIPYLVYLFLFRSASTWVKANLWSDFEGFKKYRLQNLTICFLHAVIVGTLSITGLMYHYDKANDMVSHYDHFFAQLSLISSAYFTQDAIDMMGKEWNRYVIELLLHHLLTCVSLLMPFPARRFIIGSMWALLMETNSIFLHARTIMLISGKNKTMPQLFSFVTKANITTFVLFRFLAQFFLLYCAVTQPMHKFYQCYTFIGGCIFLVVNILLFLRILASDGLLPKTIAARFTINRDNEKKEN